MIRYTLACDAGHRFESWFPSGAAYDDQAERGLVACPICDSPRVAKALMAPSIARADKGGKMEEAPRSPAVAEPAAPVTMISEPERQMRAMLRAIREHVTRTADHVGERFADEARAMHHGDAPTRAIYGEASRDEARALLDEGIDVMPLPIAPDDRH